MSGWPGKAVVSGWFRPVARILARVGATANQVTVLGLGASALAGGAIALWPAAAWPLWLALGALGLRFVCQYVDGLLAREHGTATPLGPILNELGNVLSDAVLYLPFALIPGVPSAPVVVVVALGIVAEMTGILPLLLGRTRTIDGPLSKLPRGLVFAAIALALALGAAPGPWLGTLLAATVALAALTIWSRATAARRAAVP